MEALRYRGEDVEKSLTKNTIKEVSLALSHVCLLGCVHMQLKHVWGQAFSLSDVLLRLHWALLSGAECASAMQYQAAKVISC